MSQDYRSTLNLPKTTFSMKANLAQNEPKILEAWEKCGLYAKIRSKYSGKPKYILHDGPPYANGHIHIGHVLNKILKDIVVKFKTLQGFDSAFVPGWDCHGLPVEHQLLKELKINKYQIQQVEFRRKAHDYALKFVKIQKDEFIRLGAIGEWDNPYLTLDPKYEAAIVRSFAQLVKKGYVYRGLKPVNWCFRCETALAEAEVEYEDKVSPSIYVKFEITGLNDKLKDLPSDKKVYSLVWTTTPWTLIANVAIALNPNFKYALIEVNGELWLIQEDLAPGVLEKIGIKDYKIKQKILGKDLEGVSYKDIFKPERRKDLKFVLAQYVSKEDGTGCVHTAPGHGQEDYLTGQRYKLETVMPVNARGEFFQDIALEFKGSHVFDANKNIIEKLKGQGNIAYVENVNHTYPHCWRCKNPIIFRATEQWFMDIDKNNLRNKLLDAAKNDITWIPEAGQERISSMVQTRPDWCLSRQRYWGVPIPALICEKCSKEFLLADVIEKFADFVASDGSDSWFTKDVGEFLPKGTKCPDCEGEKFKKSGDILDVWFDSGVSHQAVLRLRKELDYPCELYLEGSDQHRGWFQSSLITAMAIDGRPPFKAVLTHGFVVDADGRKMSKSLGNVIAPQDIIKDFGADILRLWVASSDYNLDVRISDEIISRLSEGYRKIRNTLRFIISNLYDYNPKDSPLEIKNLSPVDCWALSRLSQLIDETTAHYEAFNFYKAYQAIYNFCSLAMSSFYLDVLKDLLYTSKANSPRRKASQAVLYQILINLTKLISPILSFTAEEVWGLVPREGGFSVFLSDWPAKQDSWPNKDIEADFQRILEIRDLVLKSLEEKRATGLIGSSLEAEVNLETESEIDFSLLKKFERHLKSIFIVSNVTFKKSGSFKIVIEKAKGSKCVRCWNFDERVGESSAHPALCSRCVEELK